MQNRNHITKPIYFDSTPTPGLIVEEWLPVELDGVVPNYYFISNSGTVMNIKGQIIKPALINSGYYTYRLYTGTHPKYKHVLAHRLVMMTFCPIDNPEDYTVNHINMDSSNNNLYNLEWVTQKQNNMEKNKFYHSYGSGNYKSLFDRSELHIIVEEINKGTSYSNILKLIGKEDTRNNRDYVGNIKRGKTYVKELEELGLEIIK